MEAVKKTIATTMVFMLVAVFTPMITFAGDSSIDSESSNVDVMNQVKEDVNNVAEGDVAEKPDVEDFDALNDVKEELQSEPKRISGTDGAKAGEGSIEIFTIQDLDNIRNAPDQDYILMADLDLSEATSVGGAYYNDGQGWDPIGSKAPTFTGLFDGNNHVISGIYSKGTTGSNGLFGMNEGTIINLTIENSTFEGTSGMIGSIAGGNSGLIQDCNATSTISTAGSSDQKEVGGITGVNTNGVVAYCTFNGKITVSGSCQQLAVVGGIAGVSEGTLNRNKNMGAIKCDLTGDGSSFTGGITGMSTIGEMTYNTNIGSVSGTAVDGDANAGGIAGLSLDLTKENGNGGSIYAFSKAGSASAGGIIGFNKGPINVGVNLGKVSADNNNEDNDVCCGGIAGFAGSGDNDGTIEGCLNEGIVSANGKRSVFVGGIAGRAYVIFLETSNNTGSVEGSAHLNNFTNQSSCGGVAGVVDTAVVRYCCNTGNIKANGYSNSYASAGGISGTLKTESAIQQCYNSGDVSGKLRAGGISAQSFGVVLDCYNAGTITGMSGADYVGGIIGGNFSGSSLRLVYNVGKVKGGSERGGVVGYHADGSATLTSNTVITIDYASPATLIYDSDTGTRTPSGKTCTYAQMIKAGTYTNFDFNNIWTMGSGKYKFPVLLVVPYAEDQNSINLCKSGHTWNSGTVIKKATCTTSGTKAFKCRACGSSKTTTIAATGHKYAWKTQVSAGLLKNGSKIQTCSICGGTGSSAVIPGWANSYVKSLKVKKGKKSFTVKWKKQSKANQKKFNGYEIRFSTKANMSSAITKTAKKSSKSKSIKKLKKKTTYYVQVRTFTKTSAGTFYSNWSAKKTVKTK